MALDDPTDEELDAYRLEVPFARMDRRAVPPVDILADMTDAQRVQLIGDLFVVDSTVVSVRPLMIQTGDLRLQVYSPIRDIRTELDQLRPGDRLHAFADLDEWRGKLQVVVRDDAWLLGR